MSKPRVSLFFGVQSVTLLFLQGLKESLGKNYKI